MLMSKIFDMSNFKKQKRWRGVFIRAIIILKKTFADFSAKLYDEIEPRGIGVRKPQQGAEGHKFIFDRQGETCS